MFAAIEYSANENMCSQGLKGASKATMATACIDLAALPPSWVLQLFYIEGHGKAFIFELFYNENHGAAAIFHKLYSKSQGAAAVALQR